MREGEIIRVTFENAETGWRVLRVDVNGAFETWVGVMPPVVAGVRVRGVGRQETNAKFGGEQLKTESVMVLHPRTLDGIERYLGSGLVKGIGPKTAERIVAHFGLATLDVLDNRVGRLKEIKGIGKKAIQRIHESWEEQKAQSNALIFLQGHGIPMGTAMKIFGKYGPKTMEVVEQNPYRLAIDIAGVGFKTADAIALAVGIGPDSPERAQAALFHVLRENAQNGHCYAECEALIAETSGVLGGEVPAVVIERAIDAGVEEDLLAVECVSSVGEVVMLAMYANAERDVADRLTALLNAPAQGPRQGYDHATGAELPRAGSLTELVNAAIERFEKDAGFRLAPAQREAVELCASRKVVVVTGGPGAGKTSVLRAILAVFHAANLRVGLAAPTGRAAKRMNETTGQSDAQTIHRTLGFDPVKKGFAHDATAPLPFDVLTLDESSMIDVRLMRSVLVALPDRARLVLIGDIDQLPSVGPGSVLRDVIDSGVVPTVRLTQIFRQAKGSQITVNAHRINRGETPIGDTKPGGEFYVIERTNTTEAADLIVDMVTTRLPRGFNVGPRDIQVLTPQHGAEVGTKALNKRLQDALNPPGPPQVSRGDTVFRRGDKVTQTANDYERDVFNGDVGYIAEVNTEEKILTVDFDGRLVECAGKELDSLRLAYASTIHRFQGSEQPVIVMPLMTCHYTGLARNLLYTGVTRAKRLVILIADPKALKVALGEARRENRRTLLAHRLRGEL